MDERVCLNVDGIQAIRYKLLRKCNFFEFKEYSI